MECIYCGSSNVQKRGIKHNKQVYKCHKCKKYFNVSLDKVFSKDIDFKKEYERKIPKITLLDIETLPMQVFTWSLWEQCIGINQIVRDWCLLSWSAKQLFDSHMESDVLTSKEAIMGDDKRVTQSMWKVMEESDIVIAHNGNGFDIKKLNTRFLVHDLMPPKANQVIDTLEVVKKNFGLSSNKLDFIAQLVVNDKKIKTDFDLWSACYRGEQKALDDMLTYNKHDVEVLEEVYLKIRPWIRNHPNLALYSEDDYEMCPNCGSTKLSANGYYYTCANRYESRRCTNCGALSRTRKGDLEKEKMKVILRN